MPFNYGIKIDANLSNIGKEKECKIIQYQKDGDFLIKKTGYGTNCVCLSLLRITCFCHSILDEM